MTAPKKSLFDTIGESFVDHARKATASVAAGVVKDLKKKAGEHVDGFVEALEKEAACMCSPVACPMPSGKTRLVHEETCPAAQ